MFFYGLFMDEARLKKKGIASSSTQVGFVEGYGICIGQRATLMRRPGSRAYGAIMEIPSRQVTELYGEESVADYLPEPVMVELVDGTRLEAICYNLPADKAAGTNNDYVDSLLALATRIGLPESYLDQIRKSKT